MKIKVKKKVVPPAPPPPLPNRAALVYGANGYSWVIQVENLSRFASKRGRQRILIYAISYLESWRVAETLAFTGWEIETFVISHPDLRHVQSGEPPKKRPPELDWSRKLEPERFYLPARDRLVNTAERKVMGITPNPPSQKV